MTEAQSHLQPGNTIIAAMQSNNLTDVGTGYPRKWKSSVETLAKKLEEKHFQSSFLTSNFRNSSEVYDSVKTMKTNEEFGTKIQYSLKIAKK